MSTTKTRPGYEFDPFAQQPEYVDANGDMAEEWINLLPRPARTPQILDAATGTGLMVQAFVQHWPKGWPSPQFLCVDREREACEHVGRELGKTANLRFLVSPLETMDLSPGSMDIVVWGNGIHYLSTRREALGGVLGRFFETLRPGGFLFFNSAFAEGAIVPGTEPYYRQLTFKAVRALHAKSIRQGRSAERTLEFLPHRTYEELLCDAGFAKLFLETRLVRFHLPAWRAINGFTQYARGVLSGYPPKQAAQALKEVTETVFEHFLNQNPRFVQDGDRAIPRNWLSGAFQKPAAV